jgi:hypothetical protein
LPLVVLDPGHGSPDPGATGHGHKESDLVLEDALAIGAMLVKAGVQVRLTRNTDRNVSLNNRASLANAWGADLFVSLHINSAAQLATGTETYYYHARSKRLAEAMQAAQVQSLRLRDRGVKQRAFAVIRLTRMPAVLLEPFFINNPIELRLYLHPERRELFRSNLARAIISYLGVKDLPAEQPANIKKRRRDMQSAKSILWPDIRATDQVSITNPHDKPIDVVVAWHQGDRTPGRPLDWSDVKRLVPAQKLTMTALGETKESAFNGWLTLHVKQELPVASEVR